MRVFACEKFVAELLVNRMALARVLGRAALVFGLAVPIVLAHDQQSSAPTVKPPKPTNSTVLKVSSWAPPGHLIREGLSAWCDELVKRSRRSLACDLSPSTEVAISQALGRVVDGDVDIAIAVHSLNPDRFVLTRLAELPQQSGSAEQVSVAYYRTWRRHLRNHNEHEGVRVLTVFTQTAGDLFTAMEPIERLSHVKGLKLSAGGGTAGQVLRQLGSLGADAVDVPLAATVHAITDHALDGLLSTAGNVLRYGLTDAIGHRWQVPGGLYRHSYALLMNPVAWEKLSPAAKRALGEMSGETAARIFGRAADRLEQSHQLILFDAGLSVSRAAPAEIKALQKRLGLISDAWLTQARDRGLANAAEVLRDFRNELRGQVRSQGQGQARQ